MDSASSQSQSPSSPLGRFVPDSGGSETSSTTEDTVADPNEKKRKLKSALIKRARSVAVFSLKLKERRAKTELQATENKKEKISPKNENVMVGGELSCVPIEMLISIDDVNRSIQQPIKKNSGQTQNLKTMPPPSSANRQ